MKQEEVFEQDNRAAQMESFLAQLQDDNDDEEADLQEFFAREQIPAELQGWGRRFFRKIMKVGKKYGPGLLKAGLKHGLPLIAGRR